MTTSLDRLGKLVMQRLRDEPFEFFEKLTQGHWKGPSLQRLHRDLRSLSPEQLQIVRRCVRFAVDEGIHSFLFGLQEACEKEKLELRIQGDNVLDLTDGLHGELFTEDGWQARFSKFGEAPRED
mgnify:CR=1 FL=1